MKGTPTTCLGNRSIGADMERRKSVRYNLSFPVLFGWRGSADEGHQGGGFSRDLSTTGIYVACDRECPPIDTELNVEVLVPSPASESVALKLTAHGRVIRVATSSEHSGFGAVVDFSLTSLPLYE